MSTDKGLVLRDRPGYRIAYDRRTTTHELLSLDIGGKNAEGIAQSLLGRFRGSANRVYPQPREGWQVDGYPDHRPFGDRS